MKNILLQGKNGSYTFNPRDPQSRIADGGMGVVYLGEQVETGQKVAIKVIYRELAQDERNIERARREAAINVKHPNLIRMLDFIEKDGIYHIISEYLEGQNLEEFIKQNPKISTEYAVRVINDVLNGLEALHALNPPVIHRDIKPSNIFLCYDGTVKLMDFGIARITGGERKSLTGLGTVVGSPHYSPPEQVRGEIDKINKTTDIYALGITFYELLTGNPPFDATNEFDILKKQVDEPLPENPSIPANIFEVIKKATNKEQDDRYASVNKTKEALAAVLEKPSIPNKIENKKTLKKFVIRATVLFMVLIIYIIIAIHSNYSIQDKTLRANSYFMEKEYEKAKYWYQSALETYDAFPLIPGIDKQNIKKRLEICTLKAEEQKLLKNGLTDQRDGQNYKVVKIGDQIWMAENLNFGKMINSDTKQTDNNVVEKYCYNDQKKNCDEFGGLYSFGELMEYQQREMTRGICPEGWRVPTYGDWANLISFVDDSTYSDATWWDGYQYPKAVVNLVDPKYAYYASDKYGFSVKPGGYANDWRSVRFSDIGKLAVFATANVASPSKKIGYRFYINLSDKRLLFYYMGDGDNHVSIRCIKN